MKEAEKVMMQHNWDRGDKAGIKKLLRKKLRKELEEKEFIKAQKFEILDAEMENKLCKYIRHQDTYQDH